MLDENHNNRGWKLLYKSLDDCPVDSRDCSVLKTSGHGEEDREERLFTVMPVHEPTDHGVKKNDECGSQGRDEEKHLGSLWHPSSCEITTAPDQVKHS